MALPVDRQTILTSLPFVGEVSAMMAGPKNMASSSGWPMRSRMRLLRSSGGGGNEEANSIEVKNQNTRNPKTTTAKE